MNEFRKRLRYQAYGAAVVIIFLLSLVFAGATLSVLNAGEKIDSTSVGPIYLGDRNMDEMSGVLIREIPLWRNETQYRVFFQGHELELDLSLFAFDMDSTLEHLRRGVNNDAFFSLSEGNQTVLLADLDGVFTSNLIDNLRMDAFLADVAENMGKLRQTASFDLKDYLNETIATTVLQTTDITSLNEADVDQIISLASSISIGPLRRFSILDLFADSDLTNEQMSILASGIEALTLSTGFTGFTFHNNPQLPVWGRHGANVRILRVTGYDFSFYNDLNYGLEIQILEFAPDTLTFQLLGYPYITEYVGEIVAGETIPFDTIFVKDETINASTPGVLVADTPDDTTYRLLIQAGSDGAIYHGVRTATTPGGTPVETRVFSEQYLPAQETYRENIVPKDGE